MMQDILAKVNLHLSRAKLARDELCVFKESLGAETFEDFEKVKTIDTFIYRFVKLQDMMGDKLFRIFLDKLGEYRDDMSLLDVLDKLEKLGILEDSTRWMQFRKLRNKLTHEYPSNEEEIVEGILLAIDAFVEIEKILLRVKKYIEMKNII